MSQMFVAFEGELISV